MAFKPDITDTAVDILDGLLSGLGVQRSGVTVVGVYVYTETSHETEYKQFGYKAAPRTFYMKAMRKFRAKLAGRHMFLVVSDDQAWCVDNLQTLPDVYLAAHVNSAVDLSLMALTDHAIISSGSLAWWSGYLSRGKVLYYGDFMREDVGQLYNKERLLSEYIYPGWLPF